MLYVKMALAPAGSWIWGIMGFDPEPPDDKKKKINLPPVYFIQNLKKVEGVNYDLDRLTMCVPIPGGLPGVCGPR